ncbi:MAG: hypothetical protein ACI4JJ_07255 [Huintestinicola sp.]
MNIYHYKNAMDRIEADSELISEVITKAHSQGAAHRKKQMRSRFFPLIAAAVIMLAGTTVYAAENGIFRILFGSDRDCTPFENLTGEIIADSIDIYLDGLNVTPIGYAADSYTVYSVFRLDFPEALPESEGYYEIQSDGYTHYGEKLNKMFGSFSDCESAIGGAALYYYKEDADTLYAVYVVSCNEKMFGTVDLECTCLNLARDLQGLTSESMIYDKMLFTADFHVTIPETKPLCFETEGTVFEGSSAEAAPCSIIINGDDTINGDAAGIMDKVMLNGGDSPQNNTYVTLKNGERVYAKGISISYNYGSNKVIGGYLIDLPSEGLYDQLDNFRFHAYLSYPVDTEQVVSLTISGNTMYPE